MIMTEQPKLCKNCKYYKKDRISHLLGFRGKYDECRRLMNLVTGDKKVEFCEIERRDWYPLDVCGPEGKYFEPRGSS